MSKKKEITVGCEMLPTKKEKIEPTDDILSPVESSLDDVVVEEVLTTDAIQQPAIHRERIAIVMKNFRHLTQSGPHIHHRNIQGFHGGQILWDEEIIDELLKMNAPLEVFYRDVD